MIFVPSAYAAPADAGWEAYDAGNYSQAAEIFRKIQPTQPKILGALCEMALHKKAISKPDVDLKYCEDAVNLKDPSGYYGLGIAYLYGNQWLGVDQNEKIGLGYIGNAVTLGFKVADDFLCDYYFNNANYGKAAPFCKTSAASGLPGGLYHVGVMHIEGNGAVQDFKRGRLFALLSASMNYAPAYMLLGKMAVNEKYGKPKVESAYAWFSLAAAASPDWPDPKMLAMP